MACVSHLYKKVIVTGATGYIGSNLTKRLLEEGVDVHIITRKNSDLSLLNKVLSCMTVHLHDGSMGSMVSIFQRIQPDLVFHLASYVAGTHTVEQVEKLIENNIHFGCQILEAMVSAGCSRIINTGTFWQHFGDVDSNPVNLYAATRQAFQSILFYYCDTHQLQSLSLQLFDSYGAGDPRPRLLTLIKNALTSGSRIDMTPGQQLIFLVHINDIIEAFFAGGKYLFENALTFPEMYFVRPERPVYLQELVSMISETVGRSIPITWSDKPYSLGEIMEEIDVYPIVPGWIARVDLQTGLRDVFL